VTSPEGGLDKGNLIAALGEGAFLMGLERNADVVRQVSYAPLLANVHGRTDWHGMIYFDTTRACGTVSYYLWKLFAENRPACSVNTEVELLSDKPRPIAGAIGVGTWNTAAEFKDIRIDKDGRVLFQSDFTEGAAGWRTDGGNWSVVDGAYRQSDQAVGLSFFGDESWSDYTLTLKARKLRGPEGFLIVFGRKGEERNWWNIGGWGNTEHAIEFNQNSVGRHVPGSVEEDRWYDVRVEIAGRRIRCSLDGKLVHDELAENPKRFFALAGKDPKGQLLIKAINAGAESIHATVKIEGPADISSQAMMTVLKSEHPGDNNSLENPARVVPLTTTIDVAGDSFSHEFPAYSFTILRLASPAAKSARTAADQ
jgi:alpha-L-arabinofuranosidase